MADKAKQKTKYMYCETGIPLNIGDEYKYSRVCVLQSVLEINHGSQNVLGVLTWIGGY
jgi:hypothetical protein